MVWFRKCCTGSCCPLTSHLCVSLWLSLMCCCCCKCSTVPEESFSPADAWHGFVADSGVGRVWSQLAAAAHAYIWTTYNVTCSAAVLQPPAHVSLMALAYAWLGVNTNVGAMFVAYSAHHISAQPRKCMQTQSYLAWILAATWSSCVNG